MKKLFSIFILSAFCGIATAQTVTFSEVEVKPGEKATMTLTVNVGNLEIQGFQIDNLTLPEGLSLKKKEALNTDKWSRREGLADDVDNEVIFLSNKDGDAYKVSLAGVGFLVPQNQDFEIATFEIQAATTIDYGKSTISFPDGCFAFIKPDGSKVPVNDVSFVVNVVDKYTIFLDEDNTTAPTNQAGVNVSVKRTINANEWSTICLPFAMTAEQIAEAFPETEVEIAEFKGWETTEFADEDEETALSIDVQFNSVSEMEANVPYVIRVSKDVTTIDVKDVNIVVDDPFVKVGSKSKGTYGTFAGSYVPVVIEEDNLFLSGNKFWYSTGKTQMKGYRAYFYFMIPLADYAGNVRFNISLDEQTGVNNIVNGIHDGEYYDLRGQRVETPSKGIYIKDGKKVVVK